MSLLRKRGAKCSITCHPDRPHFAKGLCEACYKEKNRPLTLLKRYQKSASKRGLSWELPDYEFWRLIGSNCTYCGDFPRPFNGVDRANSNKGYTVENSVPCCKVCNFMKGVLTVEAFVNKIGQITNHVCPSGGL